MAAEVSSASAPGSQQVLVGSRQRHTVLSTQHCWGLSAPWDV